MDIRGTRAVLAKSRRLVLLSRNLARLLSKRLENTAGITAPFGSSMPHPAGGGAAGSRHFRADDSGQPQRPQS